MGQLISDLLHMQYLQRALLAGLIVGLTCSVLSTYVVLKKLAFIGQGISHAAFGGVAFGLWLFQATTRPNLYTNIITTCFCLGVAILIGYTARRRRISEDTAIGIFLVVSMALGAIFITLRQSFTAEVFGYLFGNILMVTPVDLMSMTVLGVIVVGTVTALYKEFFFYAFDEEIASVSGLPVEFLRYMLLTLLSLTIVLSVKVVGVILVSAFLIIPGATAQLLSGSFHRMMSIAIVLGIGSVCAGLAASYFLSIPTGATIVLTQFACFLGAHVVRHR
jgi:zinc transport system permease protein